MLEDKSSIFYLQFFQNRAPGHLDIWNLLILGDFCWLIWIKQHSYEVEITGVITIWAICPLL
jgi:hypothetical protein